MDPLRTLSTFDDSITLRSTTVTKTIETSNFADGVTTMDKDGKVEFVKGNDLVEQDDARTFEFKVLSDVNESTTVFSDRKDSDGA